MNGRLLFVLSSNSYRLSLDSFGPEEEDPTKDSSPAVPCSSEKIPPIKARFSPPFIPGRTSQYKVGPSVVFRKSLPLRLVHSASRVIRHGAPPRTPLGLRPRPRSGGGSGGGSRQRGLGPSPNRRGSLASSGYATVHWVYMYEYHVQSGARKRRSLILCHFENIIAPFS